MFFKNLNMFRTDCPPPYEKDVNHPFSEKMMTKATLWKQKLESFTYSDIQFLVEDIISQIDSWVTQNGTFPTGFILASESREGYKRSTWSKKVTRNDTKPKGNYYLVIHLKDDPYNEKAPDFIYKMFLDKSFEQRFIDTLRGLTGLIILNAQCYEGFRTRFDTKEEYSMKYFEFEMKLP